MRVEDRWWPPTPLRRFAPKSPTAPRDGERSHDEAERRRGHERPCRVVADREAPGDLEGRPRRAPAPQSTWRGARRRRRGPGRIAGSTPASGPWRASNRPTTASRSAARNAATWGSTRAGFGNQNMLVASATSVTATRPSCACTRRTRQKERPDPPTKRIVVALPGPADEVRKQFHAPPFSVAGSLSGPPKRRGRARGRPRPRAAHRPRGRRA